MAAPNCVVVEHPLVRTGITILRDKTTSLGEFRRSLRELSLLVGAEAMRGLETVERRVETPLAGCTGHELLRPVVILPVLRAGLGMTEALLSLVPNASVGHVGLRRDEETFEPSSYFFKTPPLEAADVFLVDPIVATGQSAADAVDRVAASGAKSIRIIAIIGSEPGIAHLHSRHPDVPVFLATLDPALNERAYIVPGLGDAGDRYFGT